MSSTLGPLPDGGRVAIIGGGPGGSACALALHRLAAGMGRRLEITLIEGKQFVGERHYNQCTGVVSPPLQAVLENDLGVWFPYHLKRSEIQGYVLHTAREQISLDGEDQHSIALRRVQFDAYMLGEVRDRGINLVPARAVDLEFHADCVLVYTENAPVEVDVVVGAFGLDEGSATIFARTTAYRPPHAMASVVTKYHPGEEGMVAFGDYIHAFLPAAPRIEFGAITPKGNHLTINIAGRSVDTELMQSFLSDPAVCAVLPNLDQAGNYDPNDLRVFKGRFPVSSARNYYGDRYVLVGDAGGLVRAFKGKGVNSAIMTGIRAAETILQSGIARQSFDQHYRAANQDILEDLPYGRGMRLLTIFLSRYRLLDPVIRAASGDSNLRAALFDAVSAHGTYRQVLKRSLRPDTLAGILRALVRI